MKNKYRIKFIILSCLISDGKLLNKSIKIDTILRN